MAIDHAQHPVFRQFVADGIQPVPGFEVNLVGQKSNPEFGVAGPREQEYYEWIAVLEAVLEAHDTFTMFELGAGYGRWMITAACAARRKNPTVRFNLVGVEPEPTHFRWMQRHFADNDLDPAEHELLEAVVNASGKPVHFIAGHPKDWYGQAILPEGYTLAHYPGTTAAYPTAHIIEAAAVRLDDLLARHAFVDLIDMDIQGAELEVIPPNIDAMTLKVRRVYVSTHTPEIHAKVAGTFRDAGWTLRAMHGWTGKEEQTQFGAVLFVDGIQYWVNPHLAQ
jgi:FkbM family methyltransferase